ncbi:uncharacterized protein LOC127254057 [Andrographis paniculata]|uniref:uncharacterized protein LOC127254057 n=1 Tax=Andrographis paniculata TaxID=175694 RepID=UPI0021E994B6|nr:uncharacterized protein LOC127254057 [Andrographis paniculata]
MDNNGELAGFELEVVKTTSAGHARKLAASVDFSTCPDGIICVRGDGIVNEVLNGLLSRDNQKEAISIPIGIIPTGSDNSLVWTVLGVRNPVSAAIAIVKMSQEEEKMLRQQRIRQLAQSAMRLQQAVKEERVEDVTSTCTGATTSTSADTTTIVSRGTTHGDTSGVGNSGSEQSAVGSYDNDGLIEIEVRPDGSIFWPSSATRKLRPIFTTKISPKGYTWTDVPLATQQFYEEEMKKYIKWKPEHHEVVHSYYNQKACETYNHWLYEIRHEIHSGKEKLSKRVPAIVLQKWKEEWTSQNASKKLVTANSNRRGGNPSGPAEATHIGGSRSFMETSHKMGFEKWDTYEWTHTRHHDGKNYCSTKAARLKEGMDVIEEGMSQFGDTQYNRDDALLSLVHRDKKKRIFGLGSLASTVPPYRNLFTSDGRTPSTSTTDDRLARLEERFDRFENYALTIMQQLERMNARPDRCDPDGDSGAPPVC